MARPPRKVRQIRKKERLNKHNSSIQQAPQPIAGKNEGLFEMAAKSIEKQSREAAQLFKKAGELLSKITTLDDRLLSKILDLDADQISMLITIETLSEFIGQAEGFNTIYGSMPPFSIGKAIVSNILKEKGYDPSLSEKFTAYVECGFHLRLHHLGVGYGDSWKPYIDEVSRLRCDKAKDVVRLIEVLSEVESNLVGKASKYPIPGISELYKNIGRGTGLLKSIGYLAQEVIQSKELTSDKVEAMREVIKKAEEKYKKADALVSLIS